jgi:hypothetical protein
MVVLAVPMTLPPGEVAGVFTTSQWFVAHNFQTWLTLITTLKLQPLLDLPLGLFT